MKLGTPGEGFSINPVIKVVAVPSSVPEINESLIEISASGRYQRPIRLFLAPGDDIDRRRSLADLHWLFGDRRNLDLPELFQADLGERHFRSRIVVCPTVLDQAHKQKKGHHDLHDGECECSPAGAWEARDGSGTA